jgi:NCAIR mutase (PurE)-related protein
MIKVVSSLRAMSLSSKGCSLHKRFNGVLGLSQSQRRCSSSDLLRILEQVKEGHVSPNDAVGLLSAQETNEEVLSSFANLDHSRSQRTGFPEAVFGQGKTPQQVAKILDDMARSANEQSNSSAILATRYVTIQRWCYPLGLGSSLTTLTFIPCFNRRVTPDMYREFSTYEFANGVIHYHAEANIVSMQASAFVEPEVAAVPKNTGPRVVVATAGTTDIPVAEEAAVTLEMSGIEVDRVFDVGVAGLHRIIRALPRLCHPDVQSIIVCAGMDGALPSVIGGLVRVPVIAVPTSIGYGASFGGVSAMLTMMNSCSPGVGVVNIDNGFGAAALAFKCIGTKNHKD